MPQRDDVSIDVGDLFLQAPDGTSMRLSSLTGVQLVVLWRHRH